MRVLSLFDGIAGAMIACQTLGFQPDEYYASEIDKYAIELVGCKYRDSVRQIGDVRGIRGEKFKSVDLLIGGSPCFTSDTLVLTRNGPKEISEILPGELVLTHEKRFRKVINVGVKLVEETVELKGMGFDKISTTEDHPFLCRVKHQKWDNNLRRYKRLFCKPEWIVSSNLDKNSFLGQSSFPETNEVYQTEDFWRFVGRFTADGWVTKYKRKYRKNSFQYKIVVCCGKHEKDDLEDIFGRLQINYCVVEERTAFKFQLNNMGLFEFLIDCGHMAHNKVVHPLLFTLSTNLKRAYLDGYFSGDGHFDKARKMHVASTTSRKLAYGIKQLIIDSFGVPVRLRKQSNNNTCIIEGRTCKQRDGYTVAFKYDSRKQDHAFEERGYIWSPLRKIKLVKEKRFVWNLEVEEDNSFTANGVFVHNCQSFSGAGKKAGLSGESGLVLEYVRILNECNPRYFLLENVGSMSKEHRAAVTSLMGVEPISIDSSLMTAQVRKRLYWTNIPGIKQPEDRKISLHDVCTDEFGCREVPSHLFLSPEYSFVRFDEPKRSRSGLIQIGGVHRTGTPIKPFGQGCRVYDSRGKACTLNAQSGGVGAKTGLYMINGKIRSLSCSEAETLQGFGEDYTSGFTRGVRLKMLGNSFTVPVIAHILSFARW